MRRATKTSLVLFAAALLVTVAAICTPLAFAQGGTPVDIDLVAVGPTPTPASTPVPEVPTQPLDLQGAQPQPPQSIPEKVGGFLAGVKRALEDIANLLFNREKRASSAIDLVAIVVCGGSGGLEECARKYEWSDLYLPFFQEGQVWEDFANTLREVAWGLALLAIPIYFACWLIGLRREGTLTFLASWAVLAGLLALDVLGWMAMSLVFRVIIRDLAGGSHVEHVAYFKQVLDMVFNNIQDNPPVAVIAMPVLSIAAVVLALAVLRYFYVLFTLIIMRVFNALRLTRDLVYGRWLGAVQWLLTALALYAEMTIFWVIGYLSLRILAEHVPEHLVWLAVLPIALVLLWIPSNLVKGFFGKVAETLVERVGQPPPVSPRTLPERTAEIRRRAVGRVRELGQTALGGLGVVWDIYQQRELGRLRALEEARREERRAGGDRGPIGGNPVQRAAEGLERASGPAAANAALEAEYRRLGLSTRPVTATGAATASAPQAGAATTGSSVPAGAKIEPATPTSKPHEQEDLTPTQAQAKAQPGATQQPQPTQPERLATTTAVVAALKRLGIKVEPSVVSAAIAKAPVAIGTVSTPVATTAAAIAGIGLLAAAADTVALWMAARELSSHVERYQTIYHHAGIIPEAAVEAVQASLRRRLAAARVREPFRGGEEL